MSLPNAPKSLTLDQIPDTGPGWKDMQPAARWEYMLLPKMTDGQLQERLDLFGSDGWEAVAALPHGTVVLKRQRRD